MTYEIKDLYIGVIGMVTSDGHEMTPTNNAIVTKCLDSTILFKNVITQQNYFDFWKGSDKIIAKQIANQLAITSGNKYKRVVTLYEYIQENYNKFKHSNKIILSIITKITNCEALTFDEITKLTCYLNDEKLFKKIYLKNEKIQSNKNNYIKTITNDINDSVFYDDELNKLILNLAEERKSIILVGNKGVGKNTLIKNLSYKIQKKEVPNFLRGKAIIDITDELKYSNSISFNKISKNNNIIVINDIYSILNNNKYYEIIDAIKSHTLKVIGITNIDKDTYFNDDYLNYCFNKITINEPDNATLFKIVSRTFNYYSKKNNIKPFNDMYNLINLLISFTQLENRIYNNNKYLDSNNSIYNPELVIEIIDKIFASAKVNNSKELNSNDIIYGINSCDKIYDEIKIDFIEQVKTIKGKMYVLGQKKNIIE